MKKYDVIIIILFLSLNSFGQSKLLKDQLWERVQDCYSEFEDNNEDGKLDDVNIIDDSKNGYLKVSGSVGTCGCTCSKTVAAFKNNLEDYTFLEKQTADCSWLSQITSDKNLKNIFPQNFGIKTFIPDLKPATIKQAIFYLDINIPRFGTDVEVMLKIIPIGMRVKSNQLLTYTVSEDNDNVSLQELSGFKVVLSQISDQTISLILNNEFDKIDLKDSNILENYFSRSQAELSKTAFIETLQNLKQIYNRYSSITHKTITLSWDKNKAKFIIKEKGKAVKRISFCQFLKSDIIKFWMAVC